ncbi:heme exporter protein CcmB [Sphingomonas sp. MMS24-JH45]
MTALVLRDLRRFYTGGGAALTVAFFLLVAIHFPFAVGPDAALLARVGGGVLWAAALLAALMPVERAGRARPGRRRDRPARGARPRPRGDRRRAKIVAHWLSSPP